MEIVGSEILTSLLHGISESLLVPVIIILLIFVILALISLGGLISEYFSRKKINIDTIEKIIKSISKLSRYDEIKDKINSYELDENFKIAIIKIIDNHEFGNETKKAFAEKIIEEEELRMEKSIEKTDVIVRLGPTLGLMGTLIPMGPGLAALGGGDIELLAQSIIIAFDTTVTGLAAASLAYLVSKLRKRWYEEDLSNLEVLVNSTLEILEINKNILS